MAKYGQVDWDNNTSQDSNKARYNKDTFLKLENGMTTVRFLMDKPYMYAFHKVEFENDTNQFGRNVRCATDNCPLCAKATTKKEQQQFKYIVGVIVRKTGEFKYFEFGSQIYNAINVIRKNIKGMENVMEYDINIIKNPKGGQAGFYQVVPGQKAPLTADEVEMVDNLNKTWFDEYVLPISSDEVNNTVERITKWLEKNKNAKQETAVPQPKVAKKASVVEDAPEDEKPIDDSAFNFKIMRK